MSSEFDVLKYGILTDTYHPEEVYDMPKFKVNPPVGEVLLVPMKAKVPSDHYPVKIEVVLK